MGIKKYILTKSPLPDAIYHTKKWNVPGETEVSFNEVFHYFRKHVKWQNLLERAGAISYNFIMALPPSILFLITIIPNLPFISKKVMKTQLHWLIVDIIPSKVHNAGIIRFIDDLIDNSRLGLLSFGLLAALFFASNAMMGIIRSFNKDYMGFVKKRGLHNRLTALKLTMMLFALVFGYILLVIGQSSILKLFIKDRSWIRYVDISRWVVIIILAFVSISLIFRYAPAVQKKWRFINTGSVVATLLCLLASFFFSLYVNNFSNFNALYGTIGTIMMVMGLVFINSLALLVGFELNVSIKTLSMLEAMKIQKRAEAQARAEQQALAEGTAVRIPGTGTQ